jgi:CheY-like chemotaxis protein
LATSASITGIIIADDDPMIRSVLRAKLEAIDLNVFVASDGLEAVEFASRLQAVLIMLDLNMPRLNGLLACRRIRLLPGHERTPIVILTATRGQDTETAAARVGATAYLMKPFRTALLLQALSPFLPIDDATRDLIRRNADRATAIAAAAAAASAAGNTTSGKPGSNNLLDRDRNILNVLRG